MYNEDSFKSHLFWIQVKRIFFMIVFSIIGCILGVFISSYMIDVLLFDKIYRVIIIAISTLVFFSISLLITANTGKEVQDGYWKIAVLRKLTLISKKLDSLENLDNIEKILTSQNISKKSVQSIENSNIETNNETSNNKVINKKFEENTDAKTPSI